MNIPYEPNKNRIFPIVKTIIGHIEASWFSESSVGKQSKLTNTSLNRFLTFIYVNLNSNFHQEQPVKRLKRMHNWTNQFHFT